MKLTAKLFSVLVLIALAVPVFLFNACGGDGSGSKFLLGGACGGCPNSTVPDGGTIEFVSSGLVGTTLDSSGVWCWPSVIFEVRDNEGNRMDNVCVEIETNSFVALRTSAGDCYEHLETDWKQYIRTRTNDNGTVTVDLLATSICNGLPSGETSTSAWVRVVSCTAHAMATGDITISAPGCP